MTVLCPFIIPDASAAVKSGRPSGHGFQAYIGFPFFIGKLSAAFGA
jgi:hypothetical protein